MRASASKVVDKEEMNQKTSKKCINERTKYSCSDGMGSISVSQFTIWQCHTYLSTVQKESMQTKHLGKHCQIWEELYHMPKCSVGHTQHLHYRMLMINDSI